MKPPPAKRLLLISFFVLLVIAAGVTLIVVIGHRNAAKRVVQTTPQTPVLSPAPPPPNPSLRFTAGGAPFTVALFADLHYGENAWMDWGPQQDLASSLVMETVLNIEEPDFVIYLGDVVTADNLGIPNASLYWEMAISPTRSKGIPFSSLFGNHDDMPFVWPSSWFNGTGVPPIICPPANTTAAAGDVDCSFRGTSRIELVTMELKNNNDRLSYSANGPKELWPGVSNYVLPIVSSNSNHPAVIMYLLDSGGGSYPQVISSAQASWFRTQAQALNPNGSIPEVVFWHVPSMAYAKVAPSPPNSRIAAPCVGSINYEEVDSQVAENGMMDVLARRPSVKAIFVGHNHGLDWCCPYSKLWLCFARHTGYGGYGTWPRGSRIIQMTESPFTIRSWIRMENGSEHGSIVLG